ncbi:MAG: HAD hydrolase-like protein [Candidatus Norongarragalinales archaeon]
MPLKPRTPQVHLLFDLDETLITGPEHWKRAAMAGVLTMARKPGGLAIRNPDYIRKFNLWVGWNAEALRKELSEVMNSPVNMHEAFLFHVLREEIYRKNPNDRKQFNKLVKLVSPGTGRVQVKSLAEDAARAYRYMRDRNVESGILSAMPQTSRAFQTVFDEGLNVAILSKGDQDKQEWKTQNLVLPKVRLAKPLPVFTTQRRFLWWRLAPGPKTPRAFRNAMKKMGVRKGDLVVSVGDRHSDDIIPAKKAGVHYSVLVPGRRAEDKAFLKNPEGSKADFVAKDLSEAMEKIMERVEKFRREGK